MGYSVNPKALPQNIINCMSDSDRRDIGVKTDVERESAIDKKNEDELQKKIEAYCCLLGFEKLTEENIRRAERDSNFPSHGWQYHLSKLGTKKNYILPDVTLFSRTGEYLWLELKTKTGKVREMQELLINAGHWKLARGEEEAVQVIRQWVGLKNGVLAGE